MGWAPIRPNTNGKLFVAATFTCTVVIASAFTKATASSTAGELIAIALPVVAALALAAGGLAAFFLRWPLVAAFVALLLVSVWQSIAPRLPIESAAPVEVVRIVSANLRFDNETPSAAVVSVMAARPDVLIISELTRPLDHELSAKFEFRRATWGTGFGQAVYSRFPLDPMSSPTAFDEQAVSVRVNATHPFVLHAVHLPRPTLGGEQGFGTVSFATHRRLVDALVRLGPHDEPSVVAGDLNLSDRSPGYRRLTENRVDAGRIGGWAESTFVRNILWTMLHLRIDYVLVPDDWCVAASRSVDIAGSDHRGVSADTGPCR